MVVFFVYDLASGALNFFQNFYFFFIFGRFDFTRYIPPLVAFRMGDNGERGGSHVECMISYLMICYLSQLRRDAMTYVARAFLRPKERCLDALFIG